MFGRRGREARSTRNVTLGALLVVLTLTFSGCIGIDETRPDAIEAGSIDESGFVLEASGERVKDDAALIWDGPRLDASASDEAGCSPPGCYAFPFQANVPSGFWEDHVGGIEASVRLTDGYGTFDILVVDEQGTVRAEGVWATSAGSALLEAPGTGPYEVQVRPRSGEATIEGVIQQSAIPHDPEDPRPLLPDLTVLRPWGLAIEHPSESSVPDALHEATGAKGCDPYERGEDQAVRCLRFAASMANRGEGPLEVRLTFEEGVQAATVLEGRFMQAIHHTDGSIRETQVARATFHHAHAHYHYDGFARYALYAYDLDQGERGELAAETTKAGFCFFDMRLVALEHTPTTPPYYAQETNCNAQPEEEWTSGISPGWVDTYGSGLTDQMIDITDVSDGAYELVATANAEGTLHEEDPADNEASVVLRLDGLDVETLDAR